jgi:hypothetical protein
MSDGARSRVVGAAGRHDPAESQMISSTSAAPSAAGGLRTYEIGFDGDVGDLVHRVTPSARVLSTPTCTVLWHHLDLQTELDVVLDALSAVGITPREVYESVGCSGGHQREVERDRRLEPERVRTASTYCELRIDGQLGDPILAHLRWSSRVVQTTIVRVRVSYEALRTLLAEMSAATRVDYVLSL